MIGWLEVGWRGGIEVVTGGEGRWRRYEAVMDGDSSLRE